MKKAKKQRKTILVIDDQPNWRMLLKDILENEGHTVTLASTQQEAKSQLQKQHFDIATIDMRLVDAEVYNVEGIAVLQEAKKHHVKSIILTGYPDEDQKKKAIEHYEAIAYLEKVPDGNPFDIDKFCKFIDSLS